MVSQHKRAQNVYDWGPEPGQGTAEQYWEYHGPIYKECRRVLRLGGVLAWGTGCKHIPYYNEWFGPHRRWGFTRFFQGGMKTYGAVWVVQTKEQRPIDWPMGQDTDLTIPAMPWHYKLHPCPKSIEEMRFMVKHLSSPGDVVLDPFTGTGTTLVAAKELGRHYVGCDLSRSYCRVAKMRLADCLKNNE
jgi:site-specific DNA-methyltransferase (adenine-specific)